MAERARVYPLRRELPPEPLWREVLGRRLRALRLDQAETLTETAGRAGISPQYLSEIERGRKEPSSEMIAALAGALGTTLTGLTEQVADDLRREPGIAPSASLRASGPVASGPVASGLVASGPVASGPVASGPVASGPVMLRLAA
jgi:DNA-binding XRE family transcriptional regulator